MNGPEIKSEKRQESHGAHVGVIVLGDTGRSPRMQYHAISLISMCPEIQKVSILGYNGEKCNDLIRNNPNIHDIRLSTTNRLIDWLRFIPLVHAIFKGIFLLCTLLYTLFFSLTHLDLILIQNPPSIPAALASLILSFFTGTVVIIDWHNLGFSLYLDRYKESHPLVIFSKFLEGLICSRCHHHLSVSKAMKEWLEASYGLSDVTVLYDRPPSSVFLRRHTSLSTSTASAPPSTAAVELSLKPVPEIPVEIRHELFVKLQLTDEILFPPVSFSSSTSSPSLSSSLSASASHVPVPVALSMSSGNEDIDPSWILEKTIQTIKYRNPTSPLSESITALRSDRAVLLISSTSWSPDEDFSLLLKALQTLDRSLVKRRIEGRSKDRTRIVMVITGKGPLKASFLNTWDRLQSNPHTHLQYVTLTSLWLESQDYPLLLSLADLGICLHTSSSGLDLPMKILDMFGSGIPVAAYFYSTLPELVRNGDNGIIWRREGELAAHLYRLYCEFGTTFGGSHSNSSLGRDSSSSGGGGGGGTREEIQRMKMSAYNIGNWESNWDKVMKPIIRRSLDIHEKKMKPLAASHRRSTLLFLSLLFLPLLAIAISALSLSLSHTHTHPLT